VSDSTTIVLTGGLTPDAPPAISSLTYNTQTLDLSVNFSDGSTQTVTGFGAYAQAIARQSVPVAGGVAVQAQIGMQAATSDPEHLVRQQDLANALTDSNLGKYAQAAGIAQADAAGGTNGASTGQFGFVGIWNSVLSDDDLQAMYALLQVRGARYGVTI